MFNPIKKSIPYGSHTLTLETGEIARQANGAVMVSLGDTVVLVTAVAAKKPKPGQDFFPLTVDYQEKTYAAGKIPGGFFKREGRPSEKETLTSRLIDRPLRPLFPDGLYNDVQIVATVMSVDPEIDPDIPAMIGASAAVSLSGVPFNGPIGAARVGYADGQYILNPTKSQLEKSQLNLVVAGTEAAVLMVESEAQELPEEVMLGAVVFGHQQQQAVIALIDQLVEEGGKPLWNWEPPAKDEALIALVAAVAEQEMRDAYRIRSKQERSQRIKEISAKVDAECVDVDASPDERRHAGNVLFDLEAKIVREQILAGEPRIDGRDTRTVRPIRIRTGVLPRTHGSALFTRGETQALVVATLGTARDEQIIDALMGEYRDRFMFHYNMPPYATGETGRVGSPKRREIGHGRLAKRALVAVLPTVEEFAYSLRVVSEITESNGSSSMASVCGASLALMDAGVPTKAHVAGIAMGLIKEGNRFAVLTDILGDEDHLGDMDFKVAGTDRGLTALQMDIKIQGITKEIMAVALSQAREGRLHILSLMQEAVAARAHRSVAARAADDDVQDQSREDPRRHRQGRRRHSRADRGDRHDDRHQGRRHDHHRVGQRRGVQRRAEAHRGDHRRGRSRQDLRRPGAAPARFRRDRAAAARQGRAAAHLADREGARQPGLRLPEGRPGRARQGARGRREGPRAPVDEGGRRRRREAKPAGGVDARGVSVCRASMKGRLAGRPFSAVRNAPSAT